MSLSTISFASFTIEDNRDVSGEISGWIFFWIFIYALFTSSLVTFLLTSKFKILYASGIDIEDKLLLFVWLKENLPDLLKVWISLKRDINWKIERPFNFKSARLAKVNGKVNKNFPPTAKRTANRTSPIINKILKLLDIFFDEILLTSRKNM